MVTSTYARADDDPQVPWMRELVERIKPDCESIHIMAPTYKSLSHHEIDGVPVLRFRYATTEKETMTHDEGAPNKVRSLSYKLLAIPYILSGFFAVFYWCIKFKITHLHVHWSFPHGLWAILPKYLLGVKVVFMNHGAELAIARRSKPVRFVMKYLMKVADVCVANSSHTAAETLKVSGKSSEIIPYGASIKIKTNDEPSLRTPPLLLFCGRLVQRKGIDVLLHALPEVLKTHPVQVVITGEGDRKNEWMQLSGSLNLSDTVNFAGFVSDEELQDLYASCTMYVHPAIFDDNGDTEGLGVVLIEALSYQKPVIASGVGGIVDVIKHDETGILVPEKDPIALSDAIKALLDNPEKQQALGTNGFAHVQEFFNWDRVAKQTMDLYKGLK